jgi:hypothetical protein
MTTGWRERKGDRVMAKVKKMRLDCVRDKGKQPPCGKGGERL